MPNGKKNRRPRARREPPRLKIPSCVAWFMQEVAPFIPRMRGPTSRTSRHLRNAGIEVLEAVRALLDETIEWLRQEETSPRLKRIRVED